MPEMVTLRTSQKKKKSGSTSKNILQRPASVRIMTKIARYTPPATFFQRVLLKVRFLNDSRTVANMEVF